MVKIVLIIHIPYTPFRAFEAPFLRRSLSLEMRDDSVSGD